MKPHPRIRKTVKWGGAAAFLLLCALWIGSRWFDVYWVDGGSRYVRVFAGTFVIGNATQAGPGWHGSWYHFGRVWFRPEFRWWGLGVRTTYQGWTAETPLWVPAVALFAVSTVAWRLDVIARCRGRFTLCSKCNYDRAGLAVGAVCPECGTR